MSRPRYNCLFFQLVQIVWTVDAAVVVVLDIQVDTDQEEDNISNRIDTKNKVVAVDNNRTRKIGKRLHHRIPGHRACMILTIQEVS